MSEENEPKPPPLIIRGMDKYGTHPNAVKAIRDVVTVLIDGGEHLKTHYRGCKNYDAFHMQDEGWMQYGWGPKHGDIVFSIGLHAVYQKTGLTEDDILLALSQLGHTPDVVDKMIVQWSRAAVGRRRDAEETFQRYLNGELTRHNNSWPHDQVKQAGDRYFEALRYIESLKAGKKMAEEHYGKVAT